MLQPTSVAHLPPQVPPSQYYSSNPRPFIPPPVPTQDQSMMISFNSIEDFSALLDSHSEGVHSLESIAEHHHNQHTSESALFPWSTNRMNPPIQQNSFGMGFRIESLENMFSDRRSNLAMPVMHPPLQQTRAPPIQKAEDIPRNSSIENFW